jgi:hypothetical protein
MDSQKQTWICPKLVLSNLAIELPASRVPTRISNQGHKAVQYWRALEWLKRAGIVEAQQAQSRLIKQRSSRVQDFVAIDLDKIARWRLDPFALVSLQLLLFLDSARLNPQSYGHYGSEIENYKLPEFDTETHVQWWLFAKDIVMRVCPTPETEPGFQSLLSLPSLNTGVKKRKFFMWRLKQRFEAFAPPAARYRGEV